MALKSLKPIAPKPNKPKGENSGKPKVKGETQVQPNNPMHGVKIAEMLKELVDEMGWEKMHERTGIKAFENNPTYKSSLRFLRTTPWAKEKVERLYLRYLKRKK